MKPVIVIAAANSGAGKTTTTMAMVAGLTQMGLKVQTFKVGPDYLDPSLLSWASQRPCHTLDSWMVPHDRLLEIFHRACADADLAVVEGVMGLFDGKAGAGDTGSTAEIAGILNAPVVAVLDCASASRTVGAVARGLALGGGKVDLVGAILNRVASPRHLEVCRQGLDDFGVEFLGALARSAGLEHPSRYLGLVSAEELAPDHGLAARLATALSTDQLHRIFELAGRARVPRAVPALFSGPPRRPSTRIAVARDEAFNFYYQDSLDLLEHHGAKLEYFSPLRDGQLPPDVGGVYLGGGYPELFAPQLAGNQGLRADILHRLDLGVKLYAECGGAIYAAQSLIDKDGRKHQMLGTWPALISMREPQRQLGYRTIRATGANMLGTVELNAHEFHHASISRPGDDGHAAWQVLAPEPGLEGYADGRVTISFMHLHLAASDGLAAAMVKAMTSA